MVHLTCILHALTCVPHARTCRSPVLVTFVHIPAWYLFYDLFAMFDAFTLRKNLRHLSWGRQLRQYVTKKSGLVCHHIILFLFGYLLVAVSGVLTYHK